MKTQNYWRSQLGTTGKSRIPSLYLRNRPYNRSSVGKPHKANFENPVEDEQTADPIKWLLIQNR